jgi:hypothetical protein
MEKVKKVRTKSLPARINRVRDIIESAGNTIGSVEFTKRSDGKVRKMAYRLHVKPEDVNKNENHIERRISDPKEFALARMALRERIHKKREKDLKNLQMTVFDTNVRQKGRSSYRIIPLENVSRVRVKGVTYEIV